MKDSLIKDNGISSKNANLNNSILLKSVSCCYCYCSATNGIFRSESRVLLTRENHTNCSKQGEYDIISPCGWGVGNFGIKRIGMTVGNRRKLP